MKIAQLFDIFHAFYEYFIVGASVCFCWAWVTFFGSIVRLLYLKFALTRVL